MVTKTKTRHSVYKSVVAIETQSLAADLALVSRQINQLEQQIKAIEDGIEDCETKLRNQFTREAKVTIQDYDLIRQHMVYLDEILQGLTKQLTEQRQHYQRILASWNKSRKLEDKCQERHEQQLQEIDKEKLRKIEMDIEERAMQMHKADEHV